MGHENTCLSPLSHVFTVKVRLCVGVERRYPFMREIVVGTITVYNCMNVGHANTCLSLLSTVFTVIVVQCKIVCREDYL